MTPRLEEDRRPVKQNKVTRSSAIANQNLLDERTKWPYSSNIAQNLNTCRCFRALTEYSLTIVQLSHGALPTR
jgi:hypothetical protein